MELTRQKLVLKRLCDAARNQERIEWPEHSGNRLPPAEVPMPILQGKECGGSAANVRLNELRMPEERSKGRRGIPIEMNVRDYMMDGQHHRVFTYKIAFHNPASVDRYIDLHNCCLRKDEIAAAGGKIVEIDDDAKGRAKPGKAVRVMTCAEHQQHLAQSTNIQQHPLTPHLFNQ